MVVLRNAPQSCNKANLGPILVHKTGPIKPTGSNRLHKAENIMFYPFKSKPQNLWNGFGDMDLKVAKRPILAQYWPRKEAQLNLQSPNLYTWQRIIFELSDHKEAKRPIFAQYWPIKQVQ